MSTPESPGTTRPAGEGLTDEQAAAEVADQTSSDLKNEDVFKREPMALRPMHLPTK